MLNLNLTKTIGTMNLEVDLALPEQGVTAIFGRSGSGKTTLIKLISGLLKPDQGKIKLGEKTLVDTQAKIFVPTAKRQIGYVFQDARLFHHYSVQGNLTYGMQDKKSPASKQQLENIIELLSLKDLLKRQPNTLSGGEQQRVAIGRALLTNPQILLMDEPLSALDLPKRQELLSYLENLANEINIPILYVTHNLDELLRLAEKMVLLEKGKVLAFDEVQAIYNSEFFQPWRV